MKFSNEYHELIYEVRNYHGSVASILSQIKSIVEHSDSSNYPLPSNRLEEIPIGMKQIKVLTSEYQRKINKILKDKL